MSEHEHALHEVTGIEERLMELQTAVNELRTELDVEREIFSAVLRGNHTAPSVVAALRKRVGEIKSPLVATSLALIADQLEKDAK